MRTVADDVPVVPDEEQGGLEALAVRGLEMAVDLAEGASWVLLDVFDDPAFLEIDDEEHSVFEERFRGIGSIRGIVIITTCFVERGERIRIINARRATAYEEGIYNENFKKYF